MALWDHRDASSHLQARQPFIEEWTRTGLRGQLHLYAEIAAGVARAPNVPLIFGSATRPSVTTTGAMLREADQVAAGLHRLGLRSGDVLVLQMPNWAEGMAAFLAALKLGVVLVPVVHIYGPAELRYILRVTQARALMLPDRWRKIDYAARVGAFDDVPSLAHVIVLGDEPMPRPVTRWREMLSPSLVPAPTHPAGPDDLAMMNFTSGTTAEPKGVLHSHAGLAVEARNMLPGPGPGFAEGDVMLWAGPGGHIASIVSYLRPFLIAEGAAYMDQLEAPVLLDLLDRYPIRRFGGAPFAISTLLDIAPAHKIRAMTGLSSGGAGVPPKLVLRAQEIGVPMVRAYGSTEHPTSTGADYDDPLDKRAYTDGKLRPGCELRLLDDEGRNVGRGERGEIVTMGAEMFLGYLDPALNEQLFTDDGWFRTGDIGVMDEQGFLTIVDRKKDIIIRGGENISSKEVEDVLMRHPAVSEAAVVAWPDAVYGERVGAFLRLHEGRSIDLPAIIEHFSAAGVARQKTPERLVIVDDFPRTPYGKILKRDLRKLVPSEP
jgi:acyl-coenzyme A synthetase/AMP-(fatty) acid ligase